MATTATPAPADDRALDTGFFGHPRGLSTLFFAELWERFSYYGMRAILILFMTASIAQGGLGFDTSVAGPIYGMYTAMVYLLALPGGWFADRVLGQQRAVLWGGILIMFGHVSLAMEGFNFFLLGLFLVVMGTGLLKPNISTMVGQLYTPDDVRRDAGFSIFYMGINIGGFSAPIVTSFLAQHPAWRGMLEGWGMDPNRAWHWGFGAAAVGMFFGLIWYVKGLKTLRGAGAVANDPLSPGVRRVAIGALAALILGGAAMFLSSGTESARFVGPIQATMTWVLLGVTGLFFAWLLTVGSRDTDERRRHVTILVLFLAASVFWAAFEQAGSTLNLFAERGTRREFLGFTVTAGMLQSVNSIFIILLAPAFAWLWVRLGRREPSSAGKFTYGLFFLALGFLLLIPAAGIVAGGVSVSPMWLIGFYFLATLGELCLSPVGLSAMTKLAPMRYAGLMLGVWFLAASVGNFIAGGVAGFYESMGTQQIFLAVALSVLLAALVLLMFVKPIRRMLARNQ